MKVLEALAMKKPVVTTSVGCEGIAVADRESVLIADQPRAFAEAVVELLRTQKLRRLLAERGFELVSQRYEWSAIGDALEAAYGAIAAARRGSSPDGVSASSHEAVRSMKWTPA